MFKGSVRTLKLKRAWVFEQGNDQKHTTSKSILKYLRVLEWPPQSLDFNIIDNMVSNAVYCTLL